MTKVLTVKTDASYKKGLGFSLAYEAEFFERGNVKDHFKNSKFIDRKGKSTDAEIIAVAYGIVETYRELDGDVDDCSLIIECDCRPAVKTYESHVNEYQNDKLQKTMEFFLDEFYSWTINWIPRETNQTADALAKEELRRAEDRV